MYNKDMMKKKVKKSKIYNNMNLGYTVKEKSPFINT